MADAKPLPKFGEWDVNDPTSAEGFTVIFNKARNEKKTREDDTVAPQNQQGVNTNNKPTPDPSNSPPDKWCACM